MLNHFSEWYVGALRRAYAGPELQQAAENAGCAASGCGTRRLMSGPWTFADETGAPVAFTAGQAVTLTLPGPLHRTFSIASSALRPGTVELTVKRNPAGAATRWMHEALLPGAVLEATLAARTFRAARLHGGSSR